MNAPRDVLVGGSIVVDGDADRRGRLDRGARAPRIRRRRCSMRRRASSRPGMIDAHQHLTGDPLVRSCIPDLLPPGESIFEWSVPLHGAHGPSTTRSRHRCRAVEALTNGVTTVVEAGTVAHADRVAAALTAVGLRATLGVWGWDIEEGPFTAPTAEVLDRQRAVRRRLPARGTGRGLGHARRSRPRVRRSCSPARRNSPVSWAPA